tara:strand:+ start:213 stop:602 length:390 start_codon:yes stop_codon:yes gene_type:complete
MSQDWSQFKNFSIEEFRCQHSGDDGMNLKFVAKLQKLRTAFGAGLTINSGYRSPEHPIEAKKATGPGSHASGRACDIRIYGQDALDLLHLALDSGDFTGIGVQQAGDRSRRFIHLDDLDNQSRPTIWSY